MKIPSLDKKILASAFSNKKSAMDVTDSFSGCVWR